MAIYKARLNRDTDGSWIAAAVALPHCWSRGKSEAEAIASLREEIRYRIEYCPCSGVEDSYVRVEIEVPGAAREPAPGRRWSPSPAPGESAAPRSGQANASQPTKPVVAAPLSGAAGCPQEPARPWESQGPRRADDPAPRSGWRRWDD